MKRKLLFLFPEGWDELALRNLATLREEFDVVCEGFDLFRFPENAQLLWFDAPRWIDQLVRKYADAKLSGVVSTNEQFGALIAAILARRLGLPGTDPVAIMRAQHKYYARRAMAVAVPDATPDFCLLPYRFGQRIDGSDPGLRYPFFVKPVKAAFSVLAARVDDAAALQRHLCFRRWETHIIKRLVRPFDDLIRGTPEFEVGAEAMLAETLLVGDQFNVDGWMDQGRIGFFGIVDALMYPGTSAFERFAYPSCLPPSTQRKALALAEKVMRALGFDHGAFNVEMFYDPRSDKLSVIEVNPRLAAQFGDLYEKVEGANPYSVLADLAVGRRPRWTPGSGRHGAAASFVFREFNGAIKVAPDRAQIRWLEAEHPDAVLQTFIKRGESRRREAKWLGSYRYAIVNLGGADHDDLQQRYEDVVRKVAFERSGAIHFDTGLDGLRPGR